METNETNSHTTKKEKPFISGSALAGTVLLIVGSVWFADRIGADIPHWVLTWPMILIAVGLFIGAKDRFRDWGWLIPTAVGAVFLIAHEVDGWSFRTLWPVIVIAVGLSMILNSFTKKKKHDDWC